MESMSTKIKKIWKFKRPLDTSKPVYVYRNLHSGLWSIRQNGLVVAHASHVYLRDAEFRVGAKGQERVRKEGKKNVHAFVFGYICNAADVRTGTHDVADDDLNYTVAYYNPYECDTFECADTRLPIHRADFVDMDIYERDKVIAIWKTPRIRENANG